MPTHTVKNEQGIEDLVRGATFLGTGGGGTPKIGFDLLKLEVDEGKELGWIDPGEIPDDAWTATVTFMGNRAPLTQEQESQKEKIGLIRVRYEKNLVRAAQILEEYTGQKIEAIVAPEIGGANIPGPIAAAIALGIPMVDGDYSGRAVPEIAQCTPCLGGKSVLPIVSVDKWGNVCIIKESVNHDVTERIGKMLAMAAFGNTGLAGFLLPGREMKALVIRGTLTESLRLGEAIRRAREKGESPVNKAIEFCKGWLLFKGRLSKKEWQVIDGYYCGYHTFQGVDEFKELVLKTWFKNETHITWRNGQPYVTSPDLIVQVDLLSGEPITNHELQKGRNVAVIGVRARDYYRTEAGLRALEPRHFGFEIDHISVENFMRT
jgi:DUF917 family protein